MSMFSICTAYVADDTLGEMLQASADVEHHFTRETVSSAAPSSSAERKGR